MGTITLQNLKRRALNGNWDPDWIGLSNWAYMGNAYYGDRVVYRAKLALETGQVLKSCSISIPVLDQGSTGYNRSTSCYLYTADPSGADSPPSAGRVDAKTQSYILINSTTLTFSFTGLNISGEYIYFYFDHGTVSGGYDAFNSSEAGVSGTFSEPVLSLSLASTRVSTGGSQLVTITNGAGKTITVTVSYGDTQIASIETNTGQATLNVTASWFTRAGVTALSEFTVGVTIDADSSLYRAFTVAAGDDMKPEIRDMIPTIVQSGNAATYFPTGPYLASISKCRLRVEPAVKGGASVRSVEVSYSGKSGTVALTYNSSTGYYEGTIGPLTQENTVLTVTVTDSRGLTGSRSFSQEVVPYSRPAISINDAYTWRCDSGGNKVSGGAYWRAMATASYYTSLYGNSLLAFHVKVQGSSTAVNLTSGQQTAAQGGTLDANTRYTLVFTIQDKVSEEITRTITLESASRGVVIRPAYGYSSNGAINVGIGLSPETSSNKEFSTVELPGNGMFLLGGFNALSFAVPASDDKTGRPFSWDFLNVNAESRVAKENANYFFYKQASGGIHDESYHVYYNVPSAVGATAAMRGYRVVLWYSGTIYDVVLYEFVPVYGRIWINHHDSSGWQGWKHLTPTAET